MNTSSRPTVTDNFGNAEWHLSGSTLNGSVAAIVSERPSCVVVSLLREDLSVVESRYGANKTREVAAMFAQCLDSTSGDLRTEVADYVAALEAAANHIDQDVYV